MGNMHEQAWKDHLWALAAALPAERRVLARRGWVGENRGLFEHPELWGPQFHMKDFKDVLRVNRVFPQHVNFYFVVNRTHNHGG
jgi:hypothetical protein